MEFWFQIPQLDPPTGNEMSVQLGVEYINHALSEMSSRVREVYCQQVADF